LFIFILFRSFRKDFAWNCWKILLWWWSKRTRNIYTIYCKCNNCN